MYINWAVSWDYDQIKKQIKQTNLNKKQSDQQWLLEKAEDRLKNSAEGFVKDRIEDLAKVAAVAMPIPAAIVGVAAMVLLVCKKKSDLNKRKAKLMKFIVYFKTCTENLYRHYKKVNETYQIYI